MTLSIITINYNNKDGLRKTIESAVSQTADRCEYIIIDGASTDGSADIIREYAEHPVYGKRISYWVSESDTGIYNAMNKGTNRASGDYCIFLNSGDYLADTTTLENLLPQLDGSTDIYYTDACYTENSSERKVITYPEYIDVNFFISGTLNHQNTVIKRQTLTESGGYNEDYRICADWLFFLSAAWKRKAVYRRLDGFISIYNRDGISSSPETASARDKERKNGLALVFGELAPTLAELCSFRDSVYGNTVSLFGTTKLLTFILKTYRFFARRLRLLQKKKEQR